jgi:hypothetical protein
MSKIECFIEDFPVEAILGCDVTDYGWRALSAKGEVLEVRGQNGHRAVMPDGELVIMRSGTRTRYAITNTVRIDDYLSRYNNAVALAREDRNVEALAGFDAAIALAPTLYARFNRALILLALGRWVEGFAEYRECEQHASFARPPVVEALAAGLKPWRGEEISGKRLLVVHSHGFGDSIMALRYVPTLRAIGAEVVLKMPPEMHRLAMQLAPATAELQDADYFCPMLHLLGLLNVAPGRVCGDPYLHIDADDVARWRARLGPGRHIGIAWSPGVQPVTGDYPRAIPLEQLVTVLGGGTTLHSVQKQGGLEALDRGVRVHEFGDFADCATMMLAMDEVVSVDTAALHLAGAIGHPDVTGLLSYWHSWRWLAPWYGKMNLRKQLAPGDWDSALVQI